MDKRKVIFWLGEEAADPFQHDACMLLIDRIEKESPLGKIIIELLELSEKGKFTNKKSEG